jgi:hypothetical protein
MNAMIAAQGKRLYMIDMQVPCCFASFSIRPYERASSLVTRENFVLHATGVFSG